MHPIIIALIVIGILLAAWYLWRTAHRIDKLHRKVVAAKISLEQQLQRRAAVSLDLAMSQLLDPASAMMLASEAYTAIDSADPIPYPNNPEPTYLEPHYTMALTPVSKHREIAESELSECLRQIFPDAQAVTEIRRHPAGDQLMHRLAAAWYRAELTRRFYNQAVTDARAARRHWYVKIFGLAGYAQLPETCNLDDALPPPIAAAAVTPPKP